MNKIIVPTGYMGSGSSAITDLISEISGYEADTGTFEYVFLHCPNGVFDLEDKLLKGNNALRSDEALHNFRRTMKQLYNKKYWWVGHYDKKLSPRFMEYTDEYIESLIQFRPAFYWYYQENADMKMIVKLIVRKIIKILSFGKVNLSKPLVYKDLMLSYISNEEFYGLTRKYLANLWKEVGIEKRNVILDQLLLPFNLFRLHNYFSEGEIKVFVVDRDPRDVFIINKYIWSKNNEPVPYPIEVNSFCDFYKKLRTMEEEVTHNDVMRIHFEDLIYNYEKKVAEILSFLQESEIKHKNRKIKFIPEKSIENTQLYLAKNQFREEAKIIEEQLSDYLYPFPYERKPNVLLSF